MQLSRVVWTNNYMASIAPLSKNGYLRLFTFFKLFIFVILKTKIFVIFETKERE